MMFFKKVLGQFFWLKKFIPKGLFGRSMLILVAPVLIIQLVSTYVFLDRHWDTLSRRLAMNLAGELTLMTHLAEEKMLLEGSLVPSAALRRGQQAMGIELEILEAEVWQILPKPDRSNYTQHLYHELAMRLGYPFIITAQPDSENATVSIYVQIPNDTVFHFLVSRKKLHSPTVSLFLLWSLGLSIVLVGVALLFLRNQIRPIVRLSRAMDAFGKGQQANLIKVGGAREVRQASTAFNRMQDRIIKHIQQRTTMLAGISHDLRTPLTRLRLQVAMLEKQLPDDSSADMKADIAEMETMIASYLSFAKGIEGEQEQPVSMNDLLAEIMNMPCANEAVIEVEISDDLQSYGRPQALKRAIHNVFANACRHGSAVFIKAFAQGESIQIIIEDNGAGIPEEQYEEAFKPFHRLDAARTPGGGSVGLGLAISRDIITNSGGSIRLGKAKQGGLKVHIILPQLLTAPL